MTNVIEIKGLTKFYGKSRGVSNISFNVKKGEILGFIGSNGAGKSTTIRSIMGLINYNVGSIKLFDEVTSTNNFNIMKRIGYLPSEVHVFNDLTVEEMIKFNSKFYDFDTLTKAHEIGDILEVDYKKKISELSFGNLKKVGIILSLMHNPELIIMDEATSGLDPLMQEKFYQILLHEKSLGHSILFSSHNLYEVKKICDSICIIKDGEIVKYGEVNKIISHDYYHVVLETLDKFPFDVKYKKDNNTYDFITNENYNDLIEKLSLINIISLQINEPSLEEQFMQYYEEEVK